MQSRKQTQPSIDGYSKTNRYTETFFHHPSRNPHNTGGYQRKYAQHEMKTFRVKGKADFQEHTYGSSLNPFARNQVRVQKIKNETGDRKKVFQDKSFKKTDPISCKYQRAITESRFVPPFEATPSYKMDIQRRNYLPAQRSLSKSNRLYHSQIGISMQALDKSRPRQIINNSSLMRSTIQYDGNSQQQSPNHFDNFKYGSRR